MNSDKSREKHLGRDPRWGQLAGEVLLLAFSIGGLLWMTLGMAAVRGFPWLHPMWFAGLGLGAVSLFAFTRPGVVAFMKSRPGATIVVGVLGGPVLASLARVGRFPGRAVLGGVISAFLVWMIWGLSETVYSGVAGAVRRALRS